MLHLYSQWMLGLTCHMSYVHDIFLKAQQGLDWTVSCSHRRYVCAQGYWLWNTTPSHHLQEGFGTGMVKVEYLPGHVLCIEMEGADMLADLFDRLVALQR